jgi:hypothetical protein
VNSPYKNPHQQTQLGHYAPRKAIQIAASAYASNYGTNYTQLYALCDDGSVWTLSADGQQWFPAPGIPGSAIPGPVRH